MPSTRQANAPTPVPRRRVGLRSAVYGGLASAAAAVAIATIPGCGVAYVLRSGWYQAELLAAREPLGEVLASDALSVGARQRLLLVPELKAYGATLGLSATDNYDTVAVGWDRTIWNVSACDPLAFQPVTWWFPIVGRVPYLGFFTDTDAREREADLRASGYDVYVRTAGAYSTLGWFRDPILPGMLRWSEAQLAETVFHELAHATLWVPGSVAFNESFASFVGEVGARRWLVDRYGEASTEVASYDREDRDMRRYEALLHEVYRDLDTIFADTGRPEAERLAAKRAVFESIPDRILASDIEDRASWATYARRSEWNNARLVQFKVYNSGEDDFAALYARHPDLPSFIDALRRITRGAPDARSALADAVKKI